MPSTFPEAFGMVAAEAAACGALPVSAGHSGMLEVSRQLAGRCRRRPARLTSFPVERARSRRSRSGSTPGCRCRRSERAAAREALVATARRLWSWEGVARGVLAAVAGRSLTVCRLCIECAPRPRFLIPNP